MHDILPRLFCQKSVSASVKIRNDATSEERLEGCREAPELWCARTHVHRIAKRSVRLLLNGEDHDAALTGFYFAYTKTRATHPEKRTKRKSIRERIKLHINNPS